MGQQCEQSSCMERQQRIDALDTMTGIMKSDGELLQSNYAQVTKQIAEQAGKSAQLQESIDEVAAATTVAAAAAQTDNSKMVHVE